MLKRRNEEKSSKLDFFAKKLKSSRTSNTDFGQEPFRWKDEEEIFRRFEKSNVKKKAIDRNESTLVSNITKTSEEKSLHQSEKLCSPKRQCNAALECSNASSSVGNLTVSSTNRVRRVNALENNQLTIKHHEELKRIQAKLRLEETKFNLMQKLLRIQIKKIEIPRSQCVFEKTSCSSGAQGAKMENPNAKQKILDGKFPFLVEVKSIEEWQKEFGDELKTRSLFERESPINDQIHQRKTIELPNELREANQRKEIEKQESTKVHINRKEVDSAKRDIRKQLVESLLDIPFPKPPPLETRLHVSLTDATFLNCIGLEEIVNMIQIMESNRKEAFPRELQPYVCCQCNIDYSPVWKEIQGKGDVVCWKCFSNDQKKEWKTDRSSCLNRMFVDAVKKEREMEQNIIKKQISRKLALCEESLSAAVLKVTSELQKQDRAKKLERKHARKPTLPMRINQFPKKPVSSASNSGFKDIRKFFP